jgi:radical SAM superfamily enzyme YgiQ (UPF0313 family)
MPRYVSAVGEGYFFPLGIAYISAVMKQASFQVFNLNLNHIEGKVENIINDEIKKNNIDVIMTGDVSPGYSCLKAIVDCVHENFHRVKIIIGGGIITAEPEVAMTALEHADIGVIGEAEATIVELCGAIQENKLLHEIAGIIYNDNGIWVQTKAREEITDLDSLPFPDYDGFELEKYLELPQVSWRGSVKGRAVFISSSRCCPYQCTFCFHTLGRKYRQRSVENVKKEIGMLVEKYNINFLNFSDELFTRDKDRAKVLCDIFRQYGIAWSASVRIDDFDAEMFEIIKQGGCTFILFGLESADNKILESMQKDLTIEQIEKTLKIGFESGVTIGGNFILGDVEDTLETANKTIDYWQSLGEDNIRIAFITVYPGTQLYKYALENSIIKDPVKFLKDGCPNINVSKLTGDDLSQITKKMLLSIEKYPAELNIISIKKNIGIMALKWKCKNCENENINEEIKILFDTERMSCKFCETSHSVPFPETLKAILLDNLFHLFGKEKRTALWGVTKFTLPFFEENDIFKKENIVFVDNSTQKQMIKIHGKNVYSPDEALSVETDAVVFFYPRQEANYRALVEREYPNVKRFINVYELLSEKRI